MDSAIDLSANSTTKTSRHSWITYRLGEFYLNYAEAIFQYTGSADNAGEFGMTACEAVNIIRNRTDVKMPEFPTGLSADAFWNKYQNERMVELAFEGHRFWDVRRWMIAEQEGVMSGAMYGIKIYWINSSPQEFRYTPYLYENRTFTKKMYLHPFSTNEVNKGYLIQNPGY